MKIPEIRAELIAMASNLEAMAKRVAVLAEETRRRKAIRRAPSKRNSVTTAQVQKYLRLHPDADYEEIATVLNTNVGRVSEALRGFRT